jgi:hypothetical protein
MRGKKFPFSPAQQKNEILHKGPVLLLLNLTTFIYLLGLLDNAHLAVYSSAFLLILLQLRYLYINSIYS